MSAEARQWAYDQDVKPSSVKFVLVTLGDIAQTEEVWASVPALVDKTGQDRKTVMSSLDKLEALGLISDTGRRVGMTGQVKVYRLNFSVANSTVFPVKSTENGTAQTVPFFPETVPNFPSNSTVFPVKSTENGTRNRKEPKEEPKEPKKQVRAPKREKPVEAPLPDGFGISERVARWAAGKGYDRLDEHLENFIGAAKAKGYTYVDWDEAFMGAIRKDWAKLRVAQPRASPSARPDRNDRRGAAAAIFDDEPEFIDVN